jgi:hypothetical protein
MCHLVAHFIDLLTRRVQLHRNNHGFFLSRPFFLPRLHFAKLSRKFPRQNKKPTRCEWVETFCVVSNYRIAPRILDGWVPKSKPIRVRAAIHLRIVFRLSQGNNKYFMPPLLIPKFFEPKYRKPARRRATRPLAPKLQ